MSKRKNYLDSIYRNPLPINLTALNLKNLVFGFDIHQDQILIRYQDFIFKALDENSIKKLWFNGFFGKGQLSRSEPTFKERTKRRILPIKDFEKLSSEEITKLRREERKKFKQERLTLEKQEILLKSNKNFEELQKIEFLKHELNSKQKISNKKSLKELFDEQIIKNGKDFNINELRKEDLLLVKKDDEGNMDIENIEYLQLMPVEAFFLRFLNLYIDNIDDDYNDHEITMFPLRKLFYTCISIDHLQPDNRFIISYIVYHHYRSLGWCVKSGIKFSTDFILYKKGPPFQHARYAVTIVPNYENDDENMENPSATDKNNWIWFSSLNRVVSGVKKNLIFCYVDIPKLDIFMDKMREIDELDDYYDEGDKFKELFELYKIYEIGIKRWLPTKNRD
ncbi:hypothetical protein PACTADRAFT_46659 [Pachysolen tannophilus NRRL Y-2460]|uniref:tRNA-splicing endonuclease subunit Sen2 n=1 Tax=Pachysolen tannophilus NRRL Y-2460 TaxID=669874 RepID=A0A1E4TN70_PACTA|nr:hypothetical protein PACTADRAFT_46659 [Pachysolen tannophilus NRRL Y-2460]